LQLLNNTIKGRLLNSSASKGRVGLEIGFGDIIGFKVSGVC
jgi:hypothetical protein